MRRKGLKMMLAGVLSCICAITSLYPVNIQAQEKTEVKKSYDIKEYIHNEILVQISDDCSEEQAKKLFHNAGTVIQETDDDCYVVKTRNNSGMKKAIASLEASNQVELVQPNFSYQADKVKYTGILTQGDVSYSENQWGLKNNGVLEFDDNFVFENKTYRNKVKEVAGIDGNVFPLWDQVKNEDGKEVVVAMIDSGVDISHQALKGKLWKNTKEVPGDHVDNDHNGYVDDFDGWNAYSLNTNLKDELGHGTHCAGVIAANGTDNIWGVAGRAKVLIMPVKVFNDKGKKSEESVGATSFSIRCGIKYAEKNGADICNLSLGMPRNDSLLEQTIEQSSMLFVCAAGNEGKDILYTPCYPGSYSFDNVLTVGNIRCDGSLHMSSNYNKELVQVVAPGTSIYSTIPDGEYEFMTGTSMATPFVAGVAALLYSYMPRLSAKAARQQICGNAKRISDMDNEIGYGLVDAYASYMNDVTGPDLKRKTTVYKSKGYAEVKLSVKDEGAAGVDTVRWASGSKSKAYFANGTAGNAVLPNGTITIKKTGYYTLYAIDKKGNESWTITKITIPEAKSVKVRSSVTLKRGGTYTLKPSVSPSGVYATYTYSSSNTAIATVNSSGKIKAKKKGTATITVRTRNGKRCTCKVTVR